LANRIFLEQPQRPCTFSRASGTPLFPIASSHGFLSMKRDHNLLFGVFAVQLNKVSPAQLMDAAGAWATDPSRDIPTRLVESNVA
jgi:hypothetical protein